MSLETRTTRICRIRRVGGAAVGGGGGGPSTPVNKRKTNTPTERQGGGAMARGGGDTGNDDDDDDYDDDEWAWGENDNDNNNDGVSAVQSASSKYGKAHRQQVQQGGNNVGLSLSEKLHRQERMEEERQQQYNQQQQKQNRQQQNQQQQSQQRGRGPIMDSDHSAVSGSDSRASRRSGNGGGSINSGWSWTSSSRGSSAFRGNGGSGSGSANKRNHMNIVNQAFGDECKLKEKIASAINCTKNNHDHDQQDGWEDDDSEWDRSTIVSHQQKPSGIARMTKIMLLVLVIFGGVFQFGRQRGHQLGELEVEEGLSRMTFDDASGSFSMSKSMSMNDQYLRGNLPSDVHEELPLTGGRVSIGTGNNDHVPDNAIIHQAVFPSHLRHLSNLTAPYNPNTETPYFWDVHFSGETVAESIFSQCHGLVQAAEFGLRQPDYNEDKLGLFPLDNSQYVNVELTSEEGIQRASQLGLASSNLADVIISPHFHSITSQIYSPKFKGRMFALFRHPVDRALSMYYYLAKASWDPHYNPALKTMTIEQYAKSRYIENNWLTRFLVDKPGGKLTHADMLLAKKIIKFKCLVGLFDDIEVSMARFQRYFGWNSKDTPEKKAGVIQCRSMAVLRGDKNLLGHPISIKEEGYFYGMSAQTSDNSGAVVRVGSVAWNAIVRMNQFDMELYEYVKKIHRIQGEQIFDVVGYESPSAGGVARSGGDNKMATDSIQHKPAVPLRAGKSMAAEAFQDTSSSSFGSGKSMADHVQGKPAALQYGSKSMAVDVADRETMLLGSSSKKMALDAVGDGGKKMALDAVGEGSVPLGSDSKSMSVGAFEGLSDSVEDAYFVNAVDGTEEELDSDEDEAAILEMPVDRETHKYCQIIYVLGVEGVGHHGFAPIINTLFEHQIDPDTSIHYERLTHDHGMVQRAFYGRKPGGRSIDDPFLVRKMIHRACPSDGAKHVLILGASFPSGNPNAKKFRVNRQQEWADMTMEEMAKSETALNHPLNLRLFAKAYSPYADIKFVVLHRPIMEILASHTGFHASPEKHLNIVSGYLLLIRQFLDDLPLDTHGNSRWFMVCMQHLSNRHYKGDKDQLDSAHQALLSSLANFLRWPQDKCDNCFDQWKDSERLNPIAQLSDRDGVHGQPFVAALNGIWPPPPPPGGNGAGEQCSELSNS